MSEEIAAVVVLVGNGPLPCACLPVMLNEMNVMVPLIVCDGDTRELSWRSSLVVCAEQQHGYTALHAGNLDAWPTHISPNHRYVCFGYSPNGKRVASLMQALSSHRDGDGDGDGDDGDDCFLPDCLLSLQARSILRPALLARCSRAVNLHNAPLPLLRGCDPFAWAIHDGLLRMGVTLHRIPRAGVDDGAIYAQRLWPIEADTSAFDLYQRALQEGPLLLRHNLLSILSGNVKAVPQDERYVTYHPMNQFDYSQKRIDWRLPHNTLSARARSLIFPPIQLPYFCVSGGDSSEKEQQVFVSRCSSEPSIKGAPCGQVVAVGAEQGFLVAAKWGSLRISTLRTEEKGDDVDAGLWALEHGIVAGSMLL